MSTPKKMITVDLSSRIDESGGYLVECGDCRDVMRLMEPESVDSIVSDPPYGIDFMGKGWDHGVPSVEFWKEAIRVAKPGAYLLAFGGTRTFHRLTVAIEDAGWEIRDTIMWVYGSGFPKSHNIGKAVDKLQGNEREVVGISKAGSKERNGYKGDMAIMPFETHTIELKTTKGKSEWEGWGTALKPAWEPIIVARKPFVGTVAANVLVHGTGGMNIDACRVKYVGFTDPRTFGGKWKTDKAAQNVYEGGYEGADQTVSAQGRFPANLIHDGSDEVTAGFPHSNSPHGEVTITKKTGGWTERRGMFNEGRSTTFVRQGDSGSAARFFYCAKANQTDRNEGCEELVPKPAFEYGSIKKSEGRTGVNTPRANNHPTVKPTDLMRYLCRLVTQPNGIVLDPFMGSGSTGKAAVLEGFRFMGIDLNEEYCTIAKSRIKSANPKNESVLF